jgi:glycosyltransferase involved in cell wall biosynthesis
MGGEARGDERHGSAVNISVVLCTYNRADSLRRALESLSRQQLPSGVEREVLIVDNNSSDHTRAVAAEAPSALPCRYIFEPRQGKSFALNTGLAAAKGDLIVFADDDLTMDRGWLAGLWRAAVAHPDCVGFGGRIVAVWSGPKPAWYCDSGPYKLINGVVGSYDHGPETKEVGMLPFGANMAFRREVFAVHGGFNLDLGSIRLMRGEDTEFGRRVRNSGGRILYVGNATVYHPVGAGKMRRGYFQAWYFSYGRHEVIVEPLPADAVRLFRVPPHVYRSLIGEIFSWLTALDSHRRFFHKLNVWRYLGQFAEFRQA